MTGRLATLETARAGKASPAQVDVLATAELRLPADSPLAARLPSAAWLPLAIALAAPPLAAQAVPESSVRGVTELAARCATGRPGLLPACNELALGAMVVQRGVGLASAAGSDIPGSPSTLGRRMGRMPRLGLSLSAAGTRMQMPGLGGASTSELQSQETASLLGLRVGAAAGVWDGFQLMPNLGGVLSVDLVGSYSFVRLPAGQGFRGSSHGFGAGARLGLVRESFTLPGLSVSAVRRWHGAVRAGSVSEGDAGELEAELAVTSFRATLGKNWFVVGVMAGAGWDRYEGDARISAAQGGREPAAAEGRVRAGRTLLFAAAWYSFLISQLSLEAGIAQGAADPFPDRVGAFDPAGRTWFAAAALRVTL